MYRFEFRGRAEIEYALGYSGMFMQAAATGVINEAAHTIAVTVLPGTDVTTLVPTITHTGHRSTRPVE